MAEMQKITCPHCGKELEIPADLEEFSCLYCGERIQRSELQKEKKELASSYEEEREYLRKNLAGTVTGYTSYYSKMSKKDFFTGSDTYESENKEVFLHLDPCAELCPRGPEACIKELCTEMLDQIEEYLKKEGRWERKNKQDNALFEIRVVLASYTTPLVRKCKQKNGEFFRKDLNRQWLERYPKHPWIPGDYDDLAGGYQRRKLCFITTATCRYDGKPDDCRELTAFRNFRDGWLMEHGGEKDIETYYEIAPSIVTMIDYCDSPEERYGEIRERWLKPCMKALDEDRPADCRSIYTDMVKTLQKRYLQ